MSNAKKKRRGDGGEGDTGALTVKWIKVTNVSVGGAAPQKRAFFRGDSSGTPQFYYVVMDSTTAAGWVKKLVDSMQAGSTITASEMALADITFGYDDSYAASGIGSGEKTITPSVHTRVQNVTT